MQTLEIKDEVATKLQQIAKQAHISPDALIEQLLSKYIIEEEEEEEQPKTLSDFIGILKDSPTFKGDPLEIQRKMRLINGIKCLLDTNIILGLIKGNLREMPIALLN